MVKNIKEVKKERKRPRKWLWEGMIMEGSVNILVGQQSRGKSMLALGLVKEMLKSRAGQTYLGRGIHAAKVLYISTEMAEDMLVNRLADLGVDGRMKNVNKRLFFYYNTAPTLADIEREVAACDPDFVVIDILGGIFAGENADINSYDDLNTIIPRLKSLNKAILLLHHMNKKNTSMGSTGTLSAMDTRLEMLETDRDLNEDGDMVIYQSIHAYGKGTRDQYINVAFTYPVFELANEEELEELDKPLAKLMQSVIMAALSAKDEELPGFEGSYQEVSAKCQLLEKYQFNPKRLGALLRMNEETLKQNNILFKTKKTKRGFRLKIWYDPAAVIEDDEVAADEDHDPYCLF